MFSLKGKAALVTGASRGIGRNVAVSLAQAGAQVALVGRDRSALDQTLAAIEAGAGSALVLEANVADAASIERAVDAARSSFGKLDVLVCNAGVQRLKPFLDMRPSDWRQLYEMGARSSSVSPGADAFIDDLRRLAGRTMPW